MARTLCRCMTYYRVQAAIRRAAGLPATALADTAPAAATDSTPAAGAAAGAGGRS
jgi:hypothetical protein